MTRINKKILKSLTVWVMTGLMVLPYGNKLVNETSSVQANEMVYSNSENQYEDSLSLTPRAVPAIKLYVDDTELEGQRYTMSSNSTATVKILFTDTQATVEPVTVQLSNNAQLLVETESDIEYLSDNVEGAITDLVVSDDGSSMTFQTGTTTRFKVQSISFQIKAATKMDGFEDFDIFAKVGTGIGTKTAKINLVSGFNIFTPGYVSSFEEFVIYGDIFYEGDDYQNIDKVFMEIVDYETNEAIEGLQFETDAVNGEFEFEPVSISDTYEDGTYIIRVYLINDQINFISMEQRFLQKYTASGIDMSLNIYNSGMDYRTVTMYAYDANGYGVPDCRFDLSVTGDATLSDQTVYASTDGRANVIVRNDTDECVYLTATTPNGVTAVYEVDFTSAPTP